MPSHAPLTVDVGAARPATKLSTAAGGNNCSHSFVLSLNVKCPFNEALKVSTHSSAINKNNK